MDNTTTPKPAQAPAMDPEQGAINLRKTIKDVFPAIGFQLDDDLILNRCRSFLESMRNPETGWDSRAR